MRGGLAIAFVAALLASGCLGLVKGEDDEPAVQPADVGYDPTSVKVTSVRKHTATVDSFDGTDLATIIYEPMTSDRLDNGSAPRWGMVVFLHGWGGNKESFEHSGASAGLPPAPPQAAGTPVASTNFLERFALAGLLAVAYDARGFGQSGGQATVAGPAELSDLDRVIAYVAANHPANGNVGVVGGSYGGGQALLSLVQNGRVTTAVSMYGWTDLYDALAPGNVPKAEWAHFLYFYGNSQSRGRLSPMVHEWYQDALTRTEMEKIRSEMQPRSAEGALAANTKPLFLCQGMEETLFPQADEAWGASAGFTRALVYTGGHGTDDPGCWDDTLDWMLYFVAGLDTAVDEWPALRTVNSAASQVVEYQEFPEAQPKAYYLRNADLVTEPSNTTFTVQQRLGSNPLQEPSGIWDQSGQANNELPQQFRNDPSGVFFATPKFAESEVLVGAAELTLALQTEPEQQVPFQVVGTLYHVDAGGRSRAISHAAYAALSGEDIANGTVPLRFTWTKTDLAPGDSVVLKLGANDNSWFMPLFANYQVTFTGQSELRLPFFG